MNMLAIRVFEYSTSFGDILASQVSNCNRIEPEKEKERTKFDMAICFASPNFASGRFSRDASNICVSMFQEAIEIYVFTRRNDM